MKITTDMIRANADNYPIIYKKSRKITKAVISTCEEEY